mmetsp:Transcript_22793/g.57969  ORF Transcript_22793/g.57969 Transcript_22793/m.57969 type:complete len:468 (-) Transcript_22793:233-1636(-)
MSKARYDVGPSAVVVIDNGGGNCKMGFAGEPAPRKVFPNCTAKPKGERQMYVGDMLLDCKEISQLNLRRPFDRGYLVGWDLEREIWGHAFKAVLGLNLGGRSGMGGGMGGLTPRECGLVLTEPMFNFPVLQSTTEQIVFEEFGFHSMHCAPAPVFSLRGMAAQSPGLPAAQAGAGVVVDVGFSFTHVVPFFDGQPLLQGVKRINIGGKALTNHLKDLVSYRSLNMMDEPYLVETVKDALCFVSQDVRADLKLAALPGLRSPHRREFVLPDGVENFRGYVRELRAPGGPPAGQAAPGQPNPAVPSAAGPGPAGGAGDDGAQGALKRPGPAVQEQVLVLNNERFMVPEVLFNPSDIGLEQAGIAETVVQAVSSLHPALHALMYTNVILTGGLAGCPGFSQRFTSELRPLVSDDYALGVQTPPDPALCAWEGMSAFGASPAYRQVAMTRAQYEETGGYAGRYQGGAWGGR